MRCFKTGATVNPGYLVLIILPPFLFVFLSPFSLLLFIFMFLLPNIFLGLIYVKCCVFLDFTWKRIVTRTTMMASVIFLAESVPHFSSILSLVGGSTVTILAYICPPIFYMKLCKMNSE